MDLLSHDRPPRGSAERLQLYLHATVKRRATPEKQYKPIPGTAPLVERPPPMAPAEREAADRAKAEYIAAHGVRKIPKRKGET